MMKRERLNKKDIIKKKIELRHKRLTFIEKKDLNIKNREPQVRNVIMPQPKTLNISNLSGSDRTALRAGLLKTGADIDKYYDVIPPIYQKKAFIDYDVVICIPSYNRYDKIKRLISQFYQQSTKYTFKIILLNDGSNDLQYDTLITEFPNIIYLKNDIPNGKILHWYCYNQMWEFLRDIQCHAVLQMDDDFILSDNFLNTIVDLFFQEKEKDNKMMAISPHLHSFKKMNNERWWNRKDFVDGIALIDDFIIKHIKYKLCPVDVEAVSKPGTPVRVWSQISDAIKYTHGWIYRMEYSLVYHDGNDDSKLHGDVRNKGKKGVYTQKYIGNL